MKTTGALVIKDQIQEMTMFRYVKQNNNRFRPNPLSEHKHKKAPVSMGFLDSSCRWGTFSGSFGCQLFTGGFATGGLTGGLLGTGHTSQQLRKQSTLRADNERAMYVLPYTEANLPRENGSER